MQSGFRGLTEGFGRLTLFLKSRNAPFIMQAANCPEQIFNLGKFFQIPDLVTRFHWATPVGPSRDTAKAHLWSRISYQSLKMRQ